eukprot:1158893-Pelagomonas_calceolata.AAC.7
MAEHGWRRRGGLLVASKEHTKVTADVAAEGGGYGGQPLVRRCTCSGEQRGTCSLSAANNGTKENSLAPADAHAVGNKEERFLVSSNDTKETSFVSVNAPAVRDNDNKARTSHAAFACSLMHKNEHK